MGKIIMPPKPLRYPYPKYLGKGYSSGKVIGRAMLIESFKGWGDYMRILDLVKFDKIKVRRTEIKSHKELRFTQYYRRPGGTNSEWIYGQGAGHMSMKTFYELIQKAKTNPDHGSFKGAFERLRFI